MCVSLCIDWTIIAELNNLFDLDSWLPGLLDTI